MVSARYRFDGLLEIKLGIQDPKFISSETMTLFFLLEDAPENRK